MCVFSSHSFWTSSSLDVPAGVTQEEGHTGFSIHLPSAGACLNFLDQLFKNVNAVFDRHKIFHIHALSAHYCGPHSSSTRCKIIKSQLASTQERGESVKTFRWKHWLQEQNSSWDSCGFVHGT